MSEAERPGTHGNQDPATVRGFGEEWCTYDQSRLDGRELQALWQAYFRVFPWSTLPDGAVGFDVGCGSGRWARLVAPRVGRLHCVDVSRSALAVARRNLADLENCEFHEASVDRMPLAENSMDFGYSLGVLHHVPDTAQGVRSCVAKLKPGAPLLLYLYYAFDNRPKWFQALWGVSDLLRRRISRLPHRVKLPLTRLIVAAVYWPLARFARVAERAGLNVSAFPLSTYRELSIYTMRTDALDRFGTRLERRFTAQQVRSMMREAGLRDIVLSPGEPFWCAVGYKA